MTASPSNTKPIGILAGGGQVPVEIADAISRRGDKVYLLAIDANASSLISAYPHDRISIGQIGQMLGLFRHHRCRCLVIAGHLSRPDLSRLRLDLGFFIHLRTILSLLRGGDDGVLRRVIGFFERQDFVVVGIADVAPELLASEGRLTGDEVAGSSMRDVSRGYELIRQLGSFDIGQAVVVRDGKVIAIEGVDGTDAMLGRLAEAGGESEAVADGTLIKATKPGQELRIDLPTIGIATVAACKKAGIATIAVEAGRSVIAEREATIELANQNSVSILGFPVIEDIADLPKKAAANHKSFACLTRHAATHKQLLDAVKGRMAVATVSVHTTQAAVIVARQHILAVNAGEPLEAFIVRATKLRQWGDRRKRKSQGVLVLSSLAEMGDQKSLEALVEARFAGIAINKPESIPPEFLIHADRLGLFVLVSE